MMIVGLTGGIGAGKSTAAEYFVEKGFAHIDADEIGHDLTAEGMPMVGKLNAYFGPEGRYGKPGVEILTPEGNLDRKAMADVVFHDDAIREIFNDIMFSAIIEEIENRISAIKEHSRAAGSGSPDGKREEEGYAGILIDAPLLFESGVNELCDVVIVIVTDEEERIMRVSMRDDATRKEVRNRMDSQMDDELKIKLADFVVDNGGSVDELYESLDEILETL